MAYFIDQQFGYRLLLNINEIRPENSLPRALILGINAGSRGPHVRPRRVFPPVGEYKQVLDGMEEEPNVSVAEYP